MVIVIVATVYRGFFHYFYAGSLAVSLVMSFHGLLSLRSSLRLPRTMVIRSTHDNDDGEDGEDGAENEDEY